VRDDVCLRVLAAISRRKRGMEAWPSKFRG
jgi:hypothetical protein